MKKNKIILPILLPTALLTSSLLITSCNKEHLQKVRLDRYIQDATGQATKAGIVSEYTSYPSDMFMLFSITFNNVSVLDPFPASSILVGCQTSDYPDLVSVANIFTEVKDVKSSNEDLKLHEGSGPISKGEYILEHEGDREDDPYRLAIWTSNDITKETKIEFKAKIDTSKIRSEKIRFSCIYDWR